MAQVKFYRGNASAYVENTYKEGIYFSMDEKVLYHNGVKFGGIDPQYFGGVTKDFDIEGNIVKFKALGEDGNWKDVSIQLVKASDSSVEIGTITNAEGTVNDGFTVKVKADYAAADKDGLKLDNSKGLYVDFTHTTAAIEANKAAIDTNKAAIDTNKANIEKLNGADNVDGSVSNKIKVAIEGLDVNAIGETGKVITAISQSYGKVSATATTLSADNVAFTASNKSFTADNVKDALDTLYAQSGEGSKVTLESAAGTESGVLNVYTIKQGGTTVGTINIPKDLVVQSGSVVKGTWQGGTFTENASGKGTALKLVIANQKAPVYINTLDLVKDHTAGDGIAISDTNKISVKKAEGSENFLTVGADGVKLAGVQNAIDTTTNNKISTLNASIKGESTHVDVTVGQANGKITSVTVANKDIASADALAQEVADRQAAIAALDLTQVGGNGQVITTISQADGKVFATAATLGAENVSASTITDDGTKVAVTGDNVKAQIASLATSIKTVSTAAAAAHTVVNPKNSGHVTVTVSKEGSHDVVTIAENDIASATALAAETSSRQTQDDTIEAAVGLNANGSHVTTSGHYTSGANTVVGEIAALDAQLYNVSTALEWINCGDYSTSQD